MKSILVLASLALSALAQRASIIFPANGTTITSGTQIVVDVHQEESTSDEVQVAVVLGLMPCTAGACEEVTPGANGIGDILYNGVFTPAFDPNEPQQGLHQNFTVNVPEFESQGPAILSLTHLELVGAEKEVTLEISGIVVNVV